MAADSRAVALALTLMLLIVGLAFQGTRALWEPDEGRYTAVALEMLDSGDYLTPRLNDRQPHLTKPPMTYWALAASIAVFGPTTWAVRLPHALAFVATGLLVFGLARRYVPQRPWLPTLVWGTSLLPVLAANVVNTDTLLVLFETLAVYAWTRSLPPAAPSAGTRPWLWLMWGAFGLAFLTKGPPGLLPLLPIVAWTVRTCGRGGLRRLLAWPGPVLFALIGGGWFLWLFARQPELIGYFFGYELYDRIFSGVHRRNPEWYGALKIYLPVLLLASLPWLLLARHWRQMLASTLTRRGWRQRWSADPDGAFLNLWLLLPLTAFFLARSRLFLYVLPLAVLAIKGALMHLPSHKDAAAHARTLQPHLHGADRIVYVGERARYGLRFYTGLPVEQFDAGASTPDICAALRRSPDALVVADAAGSSASAGCTGVAVAHVGPSLWRRASALTTSQTKDTTTWTEAAP